MTKEQYAMMFAGDVVFCTLSKELPTIIDIMYECFQNPEKNFMREKFYIAEIARRVPNAVNCEIEYRTNKDTPIAAICFTVDFKAGDGVIHYYLVAAYPFFKPSLMIYTGNNESDGKLLYSDFDKTSELATAYEKLPHYINVKK